MAFDYYTVFSLWDTFRGEHPLFTLIDEKRTNDFHQYFSERISARRTAAGMGTQQQRNRLHDRLPFGECDHRCCSKRHSRIWHATCARRDETFCRSGSAWPEILSRKRFYSKQWRTGISFENTLNMLTTTGVLHNLHCCYPSRQK